MMHIDDNVLLTFFWHRKTQTANVPWYIIKDAIDDGLGTYGLELEVEAYVGKQFPNAALTPEGKEKLKKYWYANVHERDVEYENKEQKMNLKEKLNQIASEAVIADDGYVDYIYRCITGHLESSAQNGLLSDEIDRSALMERCATDQNNKLQGPRAVSWSDGLEKALERVAGEGIEVDIESCDSHIFFSWSS